MHPSVARLVELMPPQAGAGDVVDWGQAEQRWGRLPSDYRDFVTVYGGGTINNSLYIGVPFETPTEAGSALSLSELTLDGLALLGPDPSDLPPEVTRRISWATDCSADHAFWDTADADPDKWTVLVLERHGEWVHYDCGMADFLAGFVTGGIHDAMGGFDPDGPVFLHAREEHRLRETGVDPWLRSS